MIIDRLSFKMLTRFRIVESDQDEKRMIWLLSLYINPIIFYVKYQSFSIISRNNDFLLYFLPIVFVVLYFCYQTLLGQLR